MENSGTGSAFQIFPGDNVATALADLTPGPVAIKGAGNGTGIVAVDKIPAGHKIALKDIQSGDFIVKYGVVIGEATADILKGSWVHLHNMKSRYDERSSHLNAFTGAPDDTSYE
jgi:altronate dehydratase